MSSVYHVRRRTPEQAGGWLIVLNGEPDGPPQRHGARIMKLKLLHFQIAFAALMAPAAVSLASVAKPAPSQDETPAVSRMETPRAPIAIARPAQASAAACSAKVRVVYAGYNAPASKGC